ncbi:DNA-directed RNA polymerase subunit beta [Metabacillus schmidteae]|uniref:DNA-directed RNA polymerase subunit beta n=1 Tax=Metabacillus schmidteae TaxID=2730405 RepID=UPI001F291530|nr:DNA-directed RNA polymerase subunit beta [Metabacillus schmidteae]
MVAKETTKAVSREEVKKINAKKNQEEKQDQQTEKVKLRIRLIPIWLRVVLVLLAMVISLIVGLMIGYGVIGNGNPEEALDKSTWQHIIDLVEKE